MKDENRSRPEAETPVVETVGSRSTIETASELATLLDNYLAELESGKQPDRAVLLAAHRDLAPHLEEALAGLEFVHAARLGASSVPAVLGDFRIIREVGRGGMGVVYEAEQLSLKRRVALKVLSAGASVDQVAMQRFQREAETVATLHHTNIVPIFAIGCEQGVRYYAMQFIEGRNLSELASGTRFGAQADQEPEQDIGYDDLAGWGLQAAEAIAHAHERGVIHRDIKPSNLILDRDGRIWLTDFGLARRQEDATLSLAGALLGTPRYMSPEQAGAATVPIDHRTDIYSLGATLYELATGRPIFDAATPEGVLNQILTKEPVAPRRIEATVPRDLETIILKCLLKDPAQRYGCARALAEDLRAFLEHRSIKARRPALPTQALRWARKHRRSTTVAGLSATAAVVLLATGMLATRAYWQRHQARLTLTTTVPLLQAEVLQPGSRKTVQPPFSLPTRQAVAVSPGSYEVRLSSRGVLSETHLLDLDAGQELGLDVGLQNRTLGTPFHLEGGQVELLSLDGPADFVVVRSWEIQRIDAGTGRQVWQTNLNPYELKNVFRRDSEKYAFMRSFQTLVRPAPDLDGDETGDLIWHGVEDGGTIAISGKTGDLLWFASGEPLDAEVNGGAIIFKDLEAGPPAVADLDVDGVPDIVVTRSWRMRRWAEAISGKTGKRLWTHKLDPAWLTPPAWSNVEIISSPQITTVEGHQVVCITAGTHLVVLEGREGGMLHSLDLHGIVIQQPRLGDLDGDDSPDLVLLAQRNKQEKALIAFSLRARQQLWQRTVDVPFEPEISVTKTIGWPVVTDLNSDGKAEIILPAGSETGPTAHWRTDHWSGIQVLKGETGVPLWQRSLARGRTPSVMEPLQHITIAKDLDQDGYEEIFVASLHRRSFSPGDTFLFVDALSGKTGGSVWFWSTALTDLQDKVSPVVIWEVPGEAPLLGVWSQRSLHNSQAAYILDCATGTLRHIIPAAFQLESIDCDGDKVPDLAFRTTATPEQPMVLGRQHLVRGVGHREWSRLADAQRLRSTSPDVDGDGTEDILLANPPELLSGRTGSRLWRSELSASKVILLRGRAGDMDKDGLPDLLAFRENASIANRTAPMLTAMSSRTGAILWNSEFGTARTGKLLFADSASGPDGHLPTLMAALELDVTVQSDPMIMPNRSNQVWLVVFDSGGGVKRWRQPLSPRFQGSGNAEAVSAAVADLNGDGFQDVTVGAVNATNAWELRAYSGKDGTVLWSRPLETQFDNLFNLFRKSPAPVLADLDNDGRPEVMFGHDLRRKEPDPKPNGFWYRRELVVLDGRTGELRWSHEWDEQSDQYRLTPIPVKLGPDKGTGVVFVQGRLQEAEIVTLDAQGTEIERVKTSLRHWPAQVQVADTDSNGTDEIIYVTSADKVTARAAGRNQIVWEAPGDDLLRIQSRPGSGPAVVIVGRYQTLFGLSGETGEPAWQAPASGQRFGTPLWIEARHQPSPLIVAPGPWATDAPTTGTIVCYGVQFAPGKEALAARSSGSNLAANSDTASVRQSLKVKKAERDPRLTRALPWNILHPGFTPQTQGPIHDFFIQESMLGLMLLIGLLLARAAWGRWSWRAGIPALLLVLMLIGFAIEGSRPRHLSAVYFLVVIMRAFVMIPFAVFLAAFGGSVVRAQWSRAGTLVLLAGVLALAAGGVWLIQDRKTLVEGEYYTLGGWYFIATLGAYMTGLLVAIEWLAKAAAGKLARLKGRHADAAAAAH